MAQELGLAVQVSAADGSPGIGRRATVWATHWVNMDAVVFRAPVEPGPANGWSATVAPALAVPVPDISAQRDVVPDGAGTTSCRFARAKTSLVFATVVVTESAVTVGELSVIAPEVCTGSLVCTPL